MTEAFAELVQAPHDEPQLDLAALLIAAHATPGLDIDVQLARLDDLAARVAEPTLEGLTRLLFEELAFVGNTASYYDPRNSFLDQVLDQRWGIPISLSILTTEVGRRCGVGLTCIGMPGHFLLRHDQIGDGNRGEAVYVDPFAGGRRLDIDGCEALFRDLAGPDAAFSANMLTESDNRSTLARLLNNLKMIYRRQGAAHDLAWTLRLRCSIPDVPPNDRVELAGVLANLGQYGEAAKHCEIASEQSPKNADKLLLRAAHLRARLN